MDETISSSGQSDSEEERSTMKRRHEAEMSKKDVTIKKMVKDREEIQKKYEEAVAFGKRKTEEVRNLNELLEDVVEKNRRWSKHAENKVKEEKDHWMGIVEQKEEELRRVNMKLNHAERRTREVQDENERLQWCKKRVAALEQPTEVGEADASTWKTSHITCKICAYVYNEAPERTPRMLECGHTICEGCAEKISEYRETDNRRIVKCPFDRKTTILRYGSVTSLPKNFAISDDIEQYVNTPWAALWWRFFLRVFLESLLRILTRIDEDDDIFD